MYEVETKDGLLSFPLSKNDKKDVLCFYETAVMLTWR